MNRLLLKILVFLNIKKVTSTKIQLFLVTFKRTVSWTPDDML